MTPHPFLPEERAQSPGIGPVSNATSSPTPSPKRGPPGRTGQNTASIKGRFINDITGVEEGAWNALNPSPFYSWKYLKAIQDHLRRDLVPHHLLLARGGALIGAIPAYFQRRAEYFSLQGLVRGRLPIPMRTPCLAIHSPLSFSSKVLAPGLPFKEALAAADRALARDAKKGAFGIAGYLYVEKGSAQAQILRELGYHPVFVTCTTRLTAQAASFEDFLYSPPISKNLRKKIRRELRRNKDFGMENSVLARQEADPEAFIGLHNQVFSKYNERPSLFTAGLLRDLMEAFGDNTLILTANKDGRLLGYEFLVRDGPVWHGLNMGLDQAIARESASYFVLGYDYPIMLGLQWGANAVEWRPGHIHLKAQRGAEVIPLYMYVKHFGGVAQNRLFGAYCRVLDAWYRRKYRRREISPFPDFDVAL